MADVPGKFYRATKVRTGVAPSSAGSIEGEVLPPVNPPGSSLNSVGLTMPSAFTVSNSPLTANGTIGVAGAGTVAQYIRGDGSLADFPESSGGGSSVSYYLNGSVNQGTIGGIAYKELSKVPILGAGTDFTINADGYIASFITDAGDPSLLEIPGGNWNFETYFSASSSGGTPTFYVELYKVSSGGTATLIASSSSSPELIAFGTNLNPYFSTLAVPTTTLALTDRLAVRYYVTHSGRTITLHTENNHLCQIVTTFTTGITALNGLTAQVQNFAVGTTGTDFNIASATATHTFNLPTASATNRGALSSADWSLFTQAYNDKINSAAVTGTTTKTLTLTQQDGGTITASWSDLNTDAVLSVFGRTGNVVAANGDYTTAQVTESGNLYYTDGRARGSLSFAAGSGAYNTSTGVITIPTNNNQITNGAGYITSAALSGYVQGSGSAGQVAYWSSASAITGESALFWDAINNRLGIDNASPDAPIHANGGASMTGGWNRTATLQAQYPVLVYNSNGSKWGGIGYDHTAGLRIWVNSSSFDVSSGTNALFINNIGAATFISSITASSIIRSGGTSSQYLMADGSVSTLSNPVTGTGTTNTVSKFTGTSSIGDSQIIDNGTRVGIGVNPTTNKLEVAGSLTIGTGFTSNTDIRFNNATNGKIQYIFSDSITGELGIESGLGVGIKFNTNGPNTRLIITSDGTLGFNGSSNVGNAGLDKMSMGYLNGNYGWIQTWSGTRLLLNPSGNNVVIGSTSDNGARLQVSGRTTINAGSLSGTFGLNVDVNSTFAFGSTNGRRTATITRDSGDKPGLQFGYDATDNTGIIAGATESLGAGIDFYTYNGSSWGNRMRITSGGNVGIGTPSPTNPLHIVSNTLSQLNIQALSGNTNAQINLEPSGTGIALIGPANNVDLAFRTNASPRMTITSGGNVLIGTISDNGARLQVSGNISAGNISGVTNTIGTVDMGLSGGGYATLGYNISYTSTPNTYQYKVSDTSWMLDLGNANLFRVRYAGSGTAGNTISYSNLLTINTSGAATFSSSVNVGGVSANTDFRIYRTVAPSVFFSISAPGGTPNTSILGVNGTDVMSLNASGNVGIGTTSPDDYGAGYKMLAINGSTAGILQLRSNNTGIINMVGTSTSADFEAFLNKTITFKTGTSTVETRMLITTGGNVLIGTTTDTGGDRRLQVEGNVFVNDNLSTGNGVQLRGADRPLITRGWDAFTSGNKTGVGRWGVYMEPAELFLGSPGTDYTNGLVTIGGWLVNGTRQGNLTVNNQTRNVTAFGSITATSFFESSDSSLKTLVEDNYQVKGIDSVVAKLYVKNGKQELGYFAQDLQELLPSAISKNEDGLLNLSYREVHTAKIAYLEERIKQLEKKYENN